MIRRAPTCAAAIVAVGVLSFLAPAAAAAGPRVVFTVDVETNEHFPLPEQVDAVCGGGPCGLMAIAHLLEARGWTATFFLDVYEQARWGEPALRDIAVRLQQRGQDLGLHTHPQWAYDRTRPFMYQYSLDEQTAIIRDGRHLLESWTGRPVVAHRAGAYSADERTIEALARNGIALDSSFFWSDPDCHMDALGLPRDWPAQRGRVTEIPVTAYERQTRPHRPYRIGAALRPVTVVRKIDPNWFIDATEVRAAIDGAVAADVPVIVVFLHSFSFLKSRTATGDAIADGHAMDMFAALLDKVSDARLPIVPLRAFAEPGAVSTTAHPNVVPYVAISVNWPRYVWQRAKSSGVEARRIAIAGLFFAMVVGPVLVHLARRSASRRAWGSRSIGFGAGA